MIAFFSNAAVDRLEVNLLLFRIPGCMLVDMRAIEVQAPGVKRHHAVIGQIEILKRSANVGLQRASEHKDAIALRWNAVLINKMSRPMKQYDGLT